MVSLHACQLQYYCSCCDVLYVYVCVLYGVRERNTDKYSTYIVVNHTSSWNVLSLSPTDITVHTLSIVVVVVVVV